MCRVSPTRVDPRLYSPRLTPKSLKSSWEKEMAAKRTRHRRRTRRPAAQVREARSAHPHPRGPAPACGGTHRHTAHTRTRSDPRSADRPRCSRLPVSRPGGRGRRAARIDAGRRRGAAPGLRRPGRAPPVTTRPDPAPRRARPAPGARPRAHFYAALPASS